MLQIIVVYFAPFYVFRMHVGTGYRFPAVIVAFVINYAAYFAEIYRAGIESIPVGQYEAAQVLGYSKAQTFVKIILPQVVKRVLPPVTNETITLVKDTSMAFTISIAEMFTVAKQCGLPGTGGTDDGDHLSLFHGKGDILQHSVSIKAFFHMIHF